MTSGEELQRLYYATLKGNAAIMAIANNVFDNVNDSNFGAKTAYISFGATDSTDEDVDCVSAIEVTTQIDIWSRAVGKVEAKTLTDLVRRALHKKSLQLSEHALVDTHVFMTQVFRDPDSITSHGVVQVTALIEERDE